MTSKQREAIAQLRDRKAARRESAARKLSRAPCDEAGPALLEALRAELEDPRTWKAKAAQAEALARNPHPPALGFLLAIAGDDLGGSAVNNCVGMAAMACGRDDPGPSEVLRAVVGAGDVTANRLAAVVGALTMLAEDPPALDDTLLERLLAIAEEQPSTTGPDPEYRRDWVTRLGWRLQDIAVGQSSESRSRLLAVGG